MSIPEKFNFLDKRNVQVTGGCSYMITLPKRWGNEVGLTSQSRVKLFKGPDDDLLLSATDERIEQSSTLGFVYLIAGNGLYKIGHAVNLRNRIGDIHRSVPFETELVDSIFIDDMLSLEESLLERFEDRCVKGEWFDLEDKDIELIKSSRFFTDI